MFNLNSLNCVYILFLCKLISKLQNPNREEEPSFIRKVIISNSLSNNKFTKQRRSLAGRVISLSKIMLQPLPEGPSHLTDISNLRYLFLPYYRNWNYLCYIIKIYMTVRLSYSNSSW